MYIRNGFVLLVFLAAFAACSPAVATRIAELSTPTAVSHNPGVTEVLRHPPPAGVNIEVDAYYSGVDAPAFPSPPPPPDQVACPTFLWSTALTDRPFPPVLMVINSTMGNSLPDDAAYLIAVSPEQTKPGGVSSPELPYHARLRGHFGEKVFDKCQHSDRIFMVEQVVRVYEEKPAKAGQYFVVEPPADYAKWPRYHDARLGYSLPYPPDWKAKRLDDATLSLSGPLWRDYPVTVRAHEGEIYLDPYNPNATSSLLRGDSYSVFDQDDVYNGKAETQHLTGYAVDQGGQSGAKRTLAILFSGNGYTFELSLTYPTGFDASQDLLSLHTAIVEGFRFDRAPGPTPTPPIHQNLGNGPFLSREQVLDRVRTSAADAQLLEAQLMSEAQARQAEGPGACGTFEGHPDGVWVLTVRGTFDGMTRTLSLLIDATTGKQLCGQEIAPDSTPPAPDHPGLTSTPVPITPTPAPTVTPMAH